MKFATARFAALGIVMVVTASVTAPVWGQDSYPNRPLKIIVPMAAGGGTDTIARKLAQQLAEQLKTPVVIDNRAGAGGQIGIEAAKNAPPDGYTLLIASSTALTLPYLKKTNYDLLKDFSVIGEIGRGNFVLVTRNDLGVQDAAGFFSHVRAHPGKITFGSPGHGSATHLILEMIQSKTGMEMIHVPFKSSSEVAQGIISGQVDSSIDVIPVQKKFIDSRALMGLAVTGERRDEQLRNIPTFSEISVFQEPFEASFWYAMFVQKNVSPALKAKLVSTFERIVNMPKMRKEISEFGVEPMPRNAAEFEKGIRVEADGWKKTILENKIQLQ